MEAIVYLSLQYKYPPLRTKMEKKDDSNYSTLLRVCKISVITSLRKAMTVVESGFRCV